jgi:glucosylglycerate synthase
MEPESIRSLAYATLSGPTDLVVARYHPGPREGLVNSAILYPATRALFCARPRYPLAIDLGLSLRMAERMATAAQRYTAANQEDALLWPVSEAAAAGFSIAEAEVPKRDTPQPTPVDLNALLGQILGSFFSDVDSRAVFWQRQRSVLPGREIADSPLAGEHLDVSSMLESFHLAYSNLHEIWALVLPPHTLLGLKRLSVAPRESFRMADSLWARIVYDFVLAYRLRTINRSHLLGALTPLYLAWVASHLILIESGVTAERHIEDVARAFEADKPYLVSRWRWPDRFNP